MLVLMILGISIILQFAAAVLAWRMIPITGARKGWQMICIAIFLMAVRRCITLILVIGGASDMNQESLSDDWVTMFISAFMVAGLVLIAPFLSTLRDTAKTAGIERNRLFYLLEELPALVYLLESDHSFRFVNRYFREHFGDPGEKKCYQVLGDGKTCPMCETFSVFLTKASQIWEWTRPDGHTYQVSNYPFTDIDETPLILVMAVDITDRKRTEEALRESEARYRELADSITDVFFAMDRHLRYTYWNKSSENLTGIPAKDAIGRTLYDLFPDVRRTRTENAYLRILDDGQPRNFVSWYRKGDQDLFLEINAYPSEDGISVFAKDVTDRKRAEEALRSATALLEKTFASLGEAVFLVEPETRTIIKCNAATERIFGYAREEIIGRNTEFLYIDREMYEDFGRRYFPALAKDGIFHTEYRMKRKDGSIFATENTITAISDDSGVRTGVVSVVRDITERKQAEEQNRAALAEKEVLLREIHHRVKNNLTALISLMELHAGHIKDADALRIFREFQSQIRTMAIVHKNLYQSDNLSRIDFGEYLRSLIADLFHLFGANQGIVLDTDIGDVFLSIDTAIPCGLIVNEIITNALKYAFPNNKPVTERGESRCEIRVMLRPDADAGFVLIIGDNGIGLPPGTDWRGTDTLGLKLVSILSRQLRAAVELDSRGGTTFEIRFAEQEAPNFGKRRRHDI